ncbi:hypothetical protein DACRYDRAFT_112043 [Dacryopinax primogenitus]|uniref:Uncharacterized protein n=1 Tax=Dacryopinax primogenitus (strain DJM 731) TaxID=1858805 RepID=M5FNA0_DACPD|nr:uncharacterized protein DACRYDRAFT_112043 [Dacryopinax primogenitus]EJT97080.1 hypothetical protein DACRYDRAFT_112043 [Dacryopinax primogenitus]
MLVALIGLALGGRPIVRRRLIGHGSFNAVFKYTIYFPDDPWQPVVLVARLPMSNEPAYRMVAEVTAMKFVLTRTRIPVPRVIQYCPQPINPVGAAWILQTYVDGEALGDVFKSLPMVNKERVVRTLADYCAQLHKITSPFIGSLLPGRDDRGVELCVPRADLAWPCRGDDAVHAVSRASPDGGFRIGPLNSAAFSDDVLELLYPMHRCGPFSKRSEWINACAGLGNLRDVPDLKRPRFALEEGVRVYDHLCAGEGLADKYHLNHGDLSPWNILYDPRTGALTWIDLSYTAFLPEWAIQLPRDYDDDDERFITSDDQPQPRNYAEDTHERQRLRAIFRLELVKTAPELLRAHWHGVVLRQVCMAIGDPAVGNLMVYLDRLQNLAVEPWSQRHPFWRPRVSIPVDANDQSLISACCQWVMLEQPPRAYRKPTLYL